MTTARVSVRLGGFNSPPQKRQKFLLCSGRTEGGRGGSSGGRGAAETSWVFGSCVTGGHLGSLKSFHSLKRNENRRCWRSLRSALMLRPRGKCLPYGGKKTVISEVHHWDPDTARETHRRREEDGVKDGRGRGRRRRWRGALEPW